MKKKQKSKQPEVTSVRRKAGGLRRIETSGGDRYLVLKRAETEYLLKPGTVLEETDIGLLDNDLAMEAGMRLAKEKLSRRDRSEGEIRGFLLEEGVENPEVINYIITTLKKHRYLDDREFARNYIEYRLKHRPTGPGMIRKKLMGAGVKGPVIDEAVRSCYDTARERELAESLVRGSFSPAGDRKRLVKKVNGFLRRRGFGSEITNSICSRILRKGFFEDRYE
ncbi:MAG: hypothetical protein GF417_05360 [Candidatus Latescibacteria bacterium]|nr:hypothetical protein [bacterium]MBD3423843.1 hypothetical protein [Candidatus Latescibacterota bacterium]